MKKLVYFLVLTALVLTSCKSKSGGNIQVENFSTGKAGEMILAMDSAYWSPEAQKAILEVLEQPQPALNQKEPLFDIIRCSNKDLAASFMRHRNIVQFDCSPNHSTNTFEIKKDAYTSPQIHVVIKGNDPKQCLNLFLEHQDEIVKAMYDNDIARLQNAQRKLNNPALEEKIQKKFGIKMTIPDSYFVGREEPDFLWLCYRTPKNDRFVMIYKTPAHELTRDSLVAARNRITKAYIQGAVLGAYPIVSELTGFPITDSIRIHYHQGVEQRGLWESVNDKMGGPFYSFTTMTADGSSCITVDGFIYAPQEAKRNYLREVEAIVKSIN
ncbi:MAG: DUF4837 family protein [Bacteroidales bacterium]|nr:DUF4837 family protein [Bacteroidales bacterium]